MDFDDVVIGSGMAALGVVLGLDERRRVLVLGGPAQGEYAYYDGRRTVPCAYLGAGGLGNDWHGVIPTGLRRNFGEADAADFAALFARFYPHTELTSRLGQPWLFVPWRAIRPVHELECLARARAARLTVTPELVRDFTVEERGVRVSSLKATYRARRLWVAAGALHTPALLERSLGVALRRGVVSDHVLCYVGQVGDQPTPEITRTRDGMFVPTTYGPDDCALFTRRPARFGFRRLDYGIEQRAVFGLPTGNAIKKIMRRMSPGLLAEAFYNRFGIFAAASLYTVYAQVLVPDAYALRDGAAPLVARTETIRMATDSARARQPFPGLTASHRPEICIPGIHLHHSVDLDALAKAGLGDAQAPVQVVDASVLAAIGPDHHTFKMLVAARARAREISA
jgi:hypothetical protein